MWIERARITSDMCILGGTVLHTLIFRRLQVSHPREGLPRKGMITAPAVRPAQQALLEHPLHDLVAAEILDNDPKDSKVWRNCCK